MTRWQNQPVTHALRQYTNNTNANTHTNTNTNTHTNTNTNANTITSIDNDTSHAPCCVAPPPCAVTVR